MKVNALQGMLDQFFSNQGTDVEVLAEYYRNTFLEAYKSHELTAFYEERPGLSSCGSAEKGTVRFHGHPEE